MTAPDNAAHAEFAKLAAGFALAALEPEEEQRFLSHLPTCEWCAEALLEHSNTLGHLALMAGAEEPPASVLAGIRAGVRAAPAELLRPVEAPLSLAAARAKRGERTVRLSTALMGLAASLVLVFGLISVSGLLGGSKQPDDKLAAAVQALMVPGARSVPLSGEGRAVAVVNGNRVSLVMSGVAVNDRKSSVYVLWGKSRYGGVSAVGTFDVSSQELAVVNDIGTVTGRTLEALIVTKERGRKAPQVTTQRPVVAGQV